MEILTFTAGIIIGYFIEKLLDVLLETISSLRMQRHWQQVERTWKTYQSISQGLEVVQTGWKGGSFLEEQVIVTIDNSFELPTDIAMKIREHHRAEWEAANLKDNLQFGVSKIDIHRVTDEVGGKSRMSHELVIRGHTYKYFDFLSTNRMYFSGTQEERKFLEEKINKPHYLQPVPCFPNGLSVGLSLFCEKGDCLVLTRRTKLQSTGGLWFSHRVFNAVGEGVIPADIYGDYQGNTRLSPWITAKRGLREEMGIELYQSATSSLVLHSFVWDSRILDYKFFGFAVNALSRADVRRLWTNAADRHESWEVVFLESATRNQCMQIVRDLVEHRDEWASEAILCTILSLLHLKKISPDDVGKLLSKAK